MQPAQVLPELQPDPVLDPDRGVRAAQGPGASALFGSAAGIGRVRLRHVHDLECAHERQQSMSVQCMFCYCQLIVM